MALTLAEANQVMQAAMDKAREINIKISVAVCDGGGRLMAFNRMDAAIWASAYGSQGKAIASVAFARPSGEHRRGRGRAHDPEPGGGAHHPQRRGGGCVWSGRGNRPAG